MANDKGKSYSRKKHTAAEKEKGVGSSRDRRSTSPPRPPTTAPWPRREGIPFRDNAFNEVHRVKTFLDYIHRQKGESWSRYHSTFYNQLLRNNLLPTRFACCETLARMGILEDVQGILSRIGLGNMPFRSYPLYPELVRQFLSSCDIHYDDGGHQSPQDASLTYLSSGLLYEIRITDLCDIYGFDRTARATKFPSDVPYLLDLWHTLAFGGYESRSAKLTRIRNPAIRMVAKILGALISGKAEAGAVMTDEMKMLHYGIAPTVPDLYRDTPSDLQHGVNLGFQFAKLLMKRRFRGTSEKIVDEPIGSLLTPIFQYHDIDLSMTECVDTISMFDEAHLLHTRYLSPSLVYNYVDRHRRPHTWQLPSPAVTSVTCRANCEFLPHVVDAEVDEPAEQAEPALPRQPPRRGSSSRRSQSHREDEPSTFHDQPSAGFDQTAYEELLPEYTGQYDLPPSPDVSDELDYRRWVVQSTKRQQSFLERIWGAMRRIPVPRPSCMRQQPRSERDDASRADAEATATDAEPFVAGQRPDDSGEDTEEQQLVQRLPRRRREPGQSRSVSPDYD